MTKEEINNLNTTEDIKKDLINFIERVKVDPSFKKNIEKTIKMLKQNIVFE